MEGAERDALLRQLDAAEGLVTLYLNKNKENKFANRAKKFLRRPYKYLYHNAFKLGLIQNGDVRASTFWGSYMSLPLQDENAVNVFFCGSLGRAECRLTRYLIRNLKENESFYDIGANYGFYSSLAASVIKSGEIHAFEPSPRTGEYTEKNLPHENAEVIASLNRIALSDEDGVATFFDTSVDRKSGMSTMMPEAAQSNPLRYAQIEVPTMRLDTYVSSHTPPTFIKLDVEGAESKVLAGAERVLREHAPTIAMEVWDAPHIIEKTRYAIALLTDAGYAAHEIRPDGTLRRTDIPLGSLREFNIFVFTRGE